MVVEASKVINIFYSYAHQDKALRDELDKHLDTLRRSGQINNWHDREISPGVEWEKEIDNFLNTADIILLLVSPDFIASDYCYSVEMKRAMKRHADGDARVIPILLRPVVCEDAPFSKLQSLPTNAQAITSWSNRDEAFADVAREVRKAIKEVLRSSSLISPVPSQNVFLNYKEEITTDAAPFTTLINQVINILTSYIQDTNKVGGASTTRFVEDAYEQGRRMSKAMQTRFDHETDMVKGVLKNFMEHPEEYSDNFQKRLISLLQADPDFAKKLRSVISRPLCIGCDQELQEYANFLRNDDSPWIWIFTGLEGSGKTHLLDQMKKKTPSDISVITLDFAGERLRCDPSTGEREPIDALKYLKSFVTQLKMGCDLEEYANFEGELKKAYDALDAHISLIQSFNTALNATVSGNTANIMAFPSIWLKEVQKGKRSRMASAFHKLMDSFKPNHLVIQLDTCEWLMESINVEVRQWLLQEILLPLHESMQQRQKQCHVVMMSTVALPSKESKDLMESSLDELDWPSVEPYLQRIGVDDSELRVQFYEMTYGHAKCVDILCKLWLQWEKEGQQISSVKTNKTNIQFQKEFYEKVEKDFINKDILAKFPGSPLRTLTKYGILLREFNLPLLGAVFSDLLPESGAKNVFEKFIALPYIRRPKPFTSKYRIFGLLRAVLGYSIRVQEPKIWQKYHKLAQDFLKDQTKPIELLHSLDWHYHNLAFYLTYDDKDGLGKHYWRETLADLHTMGVIPPTPLLDAARDQTLMFTSVAFEAQNYKQKSS